MTPRKKLIIAAVVFLAFVALASGVTILFNLFSPSPASEESTTTSSSSTSVESEGNDSHATDGEGSPLPLDDQEAILTKATEAAKAYVTQLPDETAEARQARLNIFFAPGSPVIEATPPIRSANYSTANVAEVESTWYNLEKDNAIGVLVYLLTTATGHSAEDYEGWVVELRQYNDKWLPYAITKSDLPYVEEGGEE